MENSFGEISRQMHLVAQALFSRDAGRGDAPCTYVNPWHAAMSQALEHGTFGAEARRKRRPATPRRPDAGRPVLRA